MIDIHTKRIFSDPEANEDSSSSAFFGPNAILRREELAGASIGTVLGRADISRRQQSIRKALVCYGKAVPSLLKR